MMGAVCAIPAALASAAAVTAAAGCSALFWSSSTAPTVGVSSESGTFRAGSLSTERKRNSRPSAATSLSPLVWRLPLRSTARSPPANRRRSSTGTRIGVAHSFRYPPPRRNRRTRPAPYSSLATTGTEPRVPLTCRGAEPSCAGGGAGPAADEGACASARADRPITKQAPNATRWIRTVHLILSRR